MGPQREMAALNIMVRFPDRYRRLLTVLCIAATLLPAGVRGEDSAPEAALKAAFIYNFTKFVEWPPSVPPGQLRLCTVGTSAVTEALGGFEGKLALGRTLTLVPAPKPGSTAQCQLVYVADSNTPRHVGEVLAEVRGRPVLTVSDHPDFLNLGGMIAISRTGDRLRFEVDLPTIQNSELKVAAPLLRMAKTVRQ